MKKQLHIFLNAIMFYTRIPVGKKVPYSDEILNNSTRYFPFVGWVVGGIGACVYWVSILVMPEALSILSSMLSTIFVTGAFHEDGFADFCDGFGGGYNQEKILSIMKDSRIGTYGSIGLIGILATKFATLFSIYNIALPLVLLVGHSFSRLMPVIIIYTSQYSRVDVTSKTKPIGKKGKGYDFVIALIFGIGLLWLIPFYFVIIIVPLLLITTSIFKKYITKKIGGYTGDCLGALQQIAEVEFYLGLVIYQHFMQ